MQPASFVLFPHINTRCGLFAQASFVALFANVAESAATLIYATQRYSAAFQKNGRPAREICTVQLNVAVLRGLAPIASTLCARAQLLLGAELSYI